ncbi:hypothetical protein CYJ76_01710 [Kytococcus schroeteri]|uniref:Uncharacterized protein n=1 Tax=Kytococcus schroeteri TaxID=138300 RepID=A0A2I1PDD2_9MICO|nr:hypothetical protein CYJ76_01710 [Kytococcus schroeteri]
MRFSMPGQAEFGTGAELGPGPLFGAHVHGVRRNLSPKPPPGESVPRVSLAYAPFVVVGGPGCAVRDRSAARGHHGPEPRPDRCPDHHRPRRHRGGGPGPAGRGADHQPHHRPLRGRRSGARGAAAAGARHGTRQHATPRHPAGRRGPPQLRLAGADGGVRRPRPRRAPRPPDHRPLAAHR